MSRAHEQTTMPLGLEERAACGKIVRLPTSFEIPTTECTGCGAQVVQASVNGHELQLEASSDVYLWCGARVFARPSNGLVVHRCRAAGS